MKTMKPAVGSQIPISDLPLASYLLASGYGLIGLRGDGLRLEFVFEAPKEAILGFYRGEDLVSARALLDAQRNLLGLAKQKR